MFLPMSCTSPFTVARTTRAAAGRALLLRLHVRLEIRNRTLHGARALDDLRQEHLSGAEEVADDLHPVHQRPLDDVERPLREAARLLGVLLDEVHDAVDERMREPLADRGLAPGEVELAARRASRDRRRVLDESFRRIGTAVEEDVLDALEQLRLDVLVDRELARVDDAHVEPGADRVVQERGVHRLPNRVVPAEGEGEVRDPARDACAGAAFLEQRDGLDERLGETGVLFDPGGHREHIRVEDDVLGGESSLAREQVVGTARGSPPCARPTPPGPTRRTPSRRRPPRSAG